LQSKYLFSISRLLKEAIATKIYNFSLKTMLSKIQKLVFAVTLVLRSAELARVETK